MYYDMNIINEIGDTPKGQEMLGRTAERAYQRAARTSGADKQRFMKTYNDAYKSGGKSSNKHLGGTRKHFDSGRDYEYEKWADEHNGNVAESKNMNKKLIRLTEQDLHKIVKESVNRILREFEEPYSTYKHIQDNGKEVVVMASFIEYTYCFDKKVLGRFNTVAEAKQFIDEIVNDGEYIQELTGEVYSNMAEGDETTLDGIIINAFMDEGGVLRAIGNGIRVAPIY